MSGLARSAAAAVLVSAIVAVPAGGAGSEIDSPTVLDVDGNGATEALSDGLLAVRFFSGFTGNALIHGAIGPGCTRCTADAIQSYLTSLGSTLDIDGIGGTPAPLTDGQLILRFLFGFSGDTLISGAVGVGCSRCFAGDVTTYLQGQQANHTPVVTAGMDQVIALPAAASLSGSADDEGLPNPPAALTQTWTQVSGPGTAMFATPNATNTTVTFDAPGVYVLRLSASDGLLTGSDSVSVTVGGLDTVLDEPNAVEEEVGENGGELDTTSGGVQYKLTIPVAALADDTMITVTPVDDILNLPLFSGGLLAAVDLQPSGLVFDRPVRLTITMPAPIDPDGVLGFLLNDDGTQLDLASVEVDGSTVTFELDHFSTGGIAQATLSDFEQDIRPILNSLPIPLTSTQAADLIRRVEHWVITFGMGICSGTDLCTTAYALAAESLTQNQLTACNQSQTFIGQGEPFLARDALAPVMRIAITLTELTERAADLGLIGFQFSYNPSCIEEKLEAISDVAEAEAIANPRAGILVLFVEIADDAALLDLGDVTQHALGSLLDALHEILEEAEADCLVAPATGEFLIDLVVNTLGNSFLEGLESGLSVVFLDARAGCSVRVMPSNPSVAFGQQQQFTGFVDGVAPSTVTWSLPGFTLGSTIDGPSGLFTAGSLAGTVIVMATSTADPSKFKKVPAEVVDGCAAPATTGEAAVLVPRTTPSCDALQAAGGTFRNAAAGTIGTALLVRLRRPDGTLVGVNVPLEVDGPPGWNGDQVLVLTYPAGYQRQFYTLTPAPVTPMIGETYTISATVAGELVTDEFTIDASSILSSPGTVVPDLVAVPGAVRSSWSAVAGAGSYLTRVFEVAAAKILVPVAFTGATAADLGVTVYSNVTHALQVFAFSNDMQPGDPLVPAQFNISFDRTFLTSSVVVLPANTTVSANGMQGLTATITGLTGGVTWSAAGGSIAPSGNTAQWTAPAQNGTYTVTATSTANSAFRGRSNLTVSNGSGGCTPELVGDRFEGTWIIEGIAIAGPGAPNCVNHPPFANFLNGGVVEITALNNTGQWLMPSTIVSYSGQFSCTQFSPGAFTAVNFNVGVGLGSDAAPNSINVFEGQIHLRSSVTPQLIPCTALISGHRQ